MRTNVKLNNVGGVEPQAPSDTQHTRRGVECYQGGGSAKTGVVPQFGRAWGRGTLRGPIEREDAGGECFQQKKNQHPKGG